jgi:hypothetical protein
MMYLPTVFGLVVLVGLLVFFWKRSGPGSGRTFGNRIAAHLGIPKNVFYALLENGVKGSSRELLASLEKSKLGLQEASVALGPSLSRGLERLETRFGPQEMYDKAKPIVARLKTENSATKAPAPAPG